MVFRLATLAPGLGKRRRPSSAVAVTGNASQRTPLSIVSRLLVMDLRTPLPPPFESQGSCHLMDSEKKTCSKGQLGHILVALRRLTGSLWTGHHPLLTLWESETGLLYVDVE